jgi:hypothetical protein
VRVLWVCDDCFNRLGGKYANPRAIKPCGMLWETRDGKRMRVKGMQDSHVTHALLYVERNAELLMARDLAAEDFDVDDPWGFGSFEPIHDAVDVMAYLKDRKFYKKLYNEARRRRLVVLPCDQWHTLTYDTPLPILEEVG